MPYPGGGASCPIEGCMKKRQPGHLMCGGHWRMVPKVLKDQVYNTWRERLDPDSSGADINAHEDAKRTALWAVEHRS